MEMRRCMAYSEDPGVFCACHCNVGVMLLRGEAGKVITLMKGCDTSTRESVLGDLKSTLKSLK